MKHDIVKWVKEACAKYRLKAIYLPENDTYSLFKHHRAVMNFDSFRFYHIHKKERMKMLAPLIKVGLAGNLGTANYQQLSFNTHQGKRIV